MHARFNATERTYNYFIHAYKDPYLTNLSAYYPEANPDVEMMKRAASLLLRYDDYSMFARSIPASGSSICKIKRSEFHVNGNGSRFRFEVTSNRFLHGMIRILVYKLLLIGRRELTLDEFETHLISKQKSSKNKLAYPHGLYLTKVVYPSLSIPPRSECVGGVEV